MHMFSKEHGLLGGFAFIGEGIPIGLGAAFQIKYRREVLGDETADGVSVNFFGDGTCNVGQFYECLNMASLYKLPCIFVVENNKWAIGMQHVRATGPSAGEAFLTFSHFPPFSSKRENGKNSLFSFPLSLSLTLPQPTNLLPSQATTSPSSTKRARPSACRACSSTGWTS